MNRYRVVKCYLSGNRLGFAVIDTARPLTIGSDNGKFVRLCKTPDREEADLIATALNQGG